MNIIKELWRGNISPYERYIKPNSEYHRIFSKYCNEADKFTKFLSQEQNHQYEQLERMQLEIMGISEEDSFIVGFRFGAKMILDIIAEYDGQFKYQSDKLTD